MSKECIRCKEIKALEEFYMSYVTFYYDSICKKCKSAYTKERRQNNEHVRKAAGEACNRWKKKARLENNPAIALVNLNYRNYKRRRNGVIGSFNIMELKVCKEYFKDCMYCGSKNDLCEEHIETMSKGGTNYISNVGMACRSCNSSKSNRDMFEWYSEQAFYSEERLQRIIVWKEGANNV